MNSSMPSQVTVVGERLLANFAREGFISGVLKRMDFQLRRCLEGLAAYFADEVPLRRARMSVLYVAVQLLAIAELTAAEIALEAVLGDPSGPCKDASIKIFHFT